MKNWVKYSLVLGLALGTSGCAFSVKCGVPSYVARNGGIYSSQDRTYNESKDGNLRELDIKNSKLENKTEDLEDKN